MKQKIISAVVMLLLATFTHAQEYKLSKTSGRLEIYIGKVTIEGYNGNEIIFSFRNPDEDVDKRAEGLRSVNSLGLDDNTGLGINVSDKGNTVEVHQLKKMHSPDIRIRVPKGIIISYKYESQYGSEATFKNLPNEIEISAQYNSITLDNVTGPLTVETTYGHVEARFDTNIKDPISIISMYGYVDVTLPHTTKANLRLSTSYGELLVSPEFDIKIDKSAGGLVAYSDKVVGTINGGGINMNLSCNYGKVYLRKK